MVLLNDAFTCATPLVMFLRSLRLTRATSGLANFLPSVRYRRCRSSSSYIRTAERCSAPRLLLLAGDRLGRTLAGAGIGVGALATNRQTLAVTQATVVTEVHEPLDVHRHVTAEVTLH